MIPEEQEIFEGSTQIPVIQADRPRGNSMNRLKVNDGTKQTKDKPKITLNDYVG